jgi:prepilin-type processing-associated H-X9-DG protein
MTDVSTDEGGVGVTGRDAAESTRHPLGGARGIGLVAIPVALFVVVAFFPVGDNGFVNWDDDLNHIEQGALYNATNFWCQCGSYHPQSFNPVVTNENMTDNSTTLSALMCPSDSSRFSPVQPNNNPPLPAPGHTNYTSSCGTNPDYCYSHSGASAFDGIFGCVDAVRPINVAAITDGLSNTGAFSERVMGIAASYNNSSSTQTLDGLTPTSSRRAAPTSWESTTYENSAPMVAYQACLNPGRPLTTSQIFSDWAYGATWLGSGETLNTYNHGMPPNSCGCGYGGATYGFMASASSRHPGTVNVLFADGSVHSIKNSIAFNVWWALGTRANGEAISADSY